MNEPDLSSARKGVGKELAVVHLVVRELGIGPFREFIASYRAHAAGREHELLIAAKQFERNEDFAPYRDELGNIPHRMVAVPDAGLDLGTYFWIARNDPFEHYCFLNSHSTIVASNWLGKLMHGAEQSAGCIVGASGSLQSVASNALDGNYPRWPKILRPLRAVLGYLKLLPCFPPFPNPHVRTNAMVISRQTLLSVDAPEIRNKYDAWRFESGRRGLTRQILSRGGQALLVNSRGEVFPLAQWARSGIFWQGDQEGLLVEDKQTRIYRDASDSRRRELRRLAWSID